MSDSSPLAPEPVAGDAVLPRRRRGGIAALLGLLAVCMVLSVLLVPSGVELAGLRAKSGQADSAMQLLEAAYQKGDRTTATLSALAAARARSGDLDGGIALMRDLAQRQPADAAGLETLADLYEQSERKSDLTATLERLQEIAPDAQRQRRLAQALGEQGLMQRQATALAALIDRFEAGEVADSLLLARLQSHLGEHARALATLQRMIRQFPESNDASVVAAQMSALLALGDADGALARAGARLAEQPESTAAEAPVLAGALMVAGRPELAAGLLDPLASGPAADAHVLTTWAQAMSDSGRLDDALARIDKDAAGVDDARLQTLRLDLALALGKAESAVAALRKVGVPSVSPAKLRSVVLLALAAGHKPGLRLLHDMAQEAIGRDDALLAARLAQATGDRASAARWGRLATGEAAREPARALQLARLLQQVGQAEAAADVLRQLAAPAEPPELLAEYARLHIALGIAPQGLAAVEKLLAARADLHVEQAWALLATASGRHADVLRWMQGSGGAHSEGSVLRDVYHLAAQGKAPELGVAAAERLVAKNRSNDADALLLVNALLQAGRNAEAANRLSALRQRTAAGEPLYAEILLAAWRQGEPVKAELRRAYAERLSHRAPSSASSRQHDVNVLLELGAHAEVLGALEPLAAADPKSWLATYIETAAKAGQPQRPVGLLRQLADDPALPEDLRPQVAFRLLELGDKASAERGMRALAAHAGPKDVATQRLLYLWGPRPTPSQREWLAARAAKSTGLDRALWMRLLTDRGGASLAIKVYRQTTWPSPNGDAVLEAYLEALAASGDRTALAGTLQEMASRTRSADLLGRLARQSAHLDDARLERRLLETAIAAGNEDPTLRRALGLLAYRTNDLQAAEHHLAAYVERSGGDGASHRALGELRLQRGDTSAAREAFERALSSLERHPDAGYAARAGKAGLLQRLKRHDEAKHLYDELLAERPGDDHLRADYVAMLLDLGQQRSARAVLEQR